MEDTFTEPAGSHEPTAHAKTPKKAAASGWIGSALEYYDFFIYAQAAALVFPYIFFPEGNAQVGIVASFATFGVGYVARPVGALVLGHLGDTIGRKTILVLCMLLMGLSTFTVALLPTYHSIGIWAPILLVTLRLIQGFAVGGEIAGASAMIVEHSPFGRRGYYTSYTLQGVQAGQLLAAAVFLPLAGFLSEEAFQSWGWRIPFLLSAFVVVAGFVIRRRVDETPVFQEESEHGEVPKAPIVLAVKENGLDMFRVFLMALLNSVPTTVTVFGLTYATGKTYGIGLSVADFLWVSVLGNIAAVCLIPFVGKLSDRIGRRPVFIVGILGAGILGYPFLYFVSQGNFPMALVISIVMWGVVYQGANAVYPSLFNELFPAATRVTAFAVSLSLGIMVTAFLPAVLAVVAPPGSNVPLIVGSILFGITIIAALSAFSARETFRVHMNDLGDKNAVPVPREDYDRIRRTGVDVPV